MDPTPVVKAQVVESSSSQLPNLPPQSPAPVHEAHAQAAPTSISDQQAASSPSATTTATAAGDEQILLVLSGLIGSGKSTFARALVDHYPNWRRCNQDELGDRHAVLFAARTALLAGQNVVIDRTNIDAKQRRTWLELARELNTAEGEPRRKVVTVSLTLTISTQVAEERLRVRVGHETIKSAEQALEILPHFLRTYQKATTEEGFNYVLTWPAAKMSMEPGMEEVKEILFERLGNEERADGVLPERPPARAGRGGRGGGGARGRGEWRGRGGRGASAVYTPHHHQPYPSRGLPQQLPSEGQQATPSSFAAAASLPPPPPTQPETHAQPQV